MRILFKEEYCREKSLKGQKSNKSNDGKEKNQFSHIIYILGQ